MSSTGTELTRTTIGSVTNQYKWTYSFWIKRSALGTGATNSFIFDWYQSSANRGGILFENDNTFKIYDRVSNSNALDRRTNRKFMDINGWYHIVIAHDRTVGSPLTKIYVNGVEETSFQSSTNPSQNGTSYFNTASQTERIGKYGNGNEYSQMIMSHVHFCDGYYYQASDFGETDSTTGEWKIKTSPSVTYGNNGYFILKDGNSLTDQSPNTNNFTVAGGTLTKTEDCPSNVFGTFNPLHIQSGRALTMSNGNGKIASNQNNWQPIGCTLAVPPKTGKWYWEFSQFIEAQTFIGIISSKCNISINLPYDATDGWISYFYAGRLTNDDTDTENYFTAISSTTDVVGVALDMTAGTYGQVQFYLNGSATGSTVALGSTFADQFVMPFAMCNGTGGRSVSLNTGNGYFGGTAVSSNSGNGYSATGSLGIFQYQPPTGYTALCTKGLNL